MTQPDLGWYLRRLRGMSPAEAVHRGLDAGLSSAQAANFAPLVFGIFLIVVMLAAPQGIVGTIRSRWLMSQAKRRRARA